MWSFFLQIIAGILGLYLADKFINGVIFTGQHYFFIPKNQGEISIFLSSLVAIGIFLGILNSIVKPILNKITFPIRIITLNLFSLIIAVAMVWITDIIFPELIINGIVPLFWTTVIVWGLGFILTKWLPSKRNYKKT
ncbi:phage holin family protein [Patescibacteria group bacterium]